MILREAGQQIELTESPYTPRLLAAAFILFGLVFVTWAAGLMPSTNQPHGPAVAWMVVLGLFAMGVAMLMLYSFPRVRLVIDRQRGVMSLDQWAMGRHARGEWPLSSITRVEIARAVRDPKALGNPSYRLQFVLTSGTTVLPTPTWNRQKPIEAAANAIGSALGLSVQRAEHWQVAGFPDRTLFNSDMLG